MRKKDIQEMKKVLISIQGLPFYSQNEDSGFELTTDGEYTRTACGSKFCYIERALNGQNDAGAMMTFDVEPDKVTMRRGDDITGDMIFSEQQKHHFLYNTPFGAVTMGIDTHSITQNMNDDGGNIEIQYDIEVDNIAVSRNLFKINIKSMTQ